MLQRQGESQGLSHGSGICNDFFDYGLKSKYSTGSSLPLFGREEREVLILWERWDWLKCKKFKHDQYPPLPDLTMMGKDKWWWIIPSKKVGRSLKHHREAHWQPQWQQSWTLIYDHSSGIQTLCLQHWYCFIIVKCTQIQIKILFCVIQANNTIRDRASCSGKEKINRVLQSQRTVD